MSGELKGACIFGQSGGPTAVINASAYGVLKTALESDVITNVYGAAHGIRGVLADRLYDIGQEDPDELRLLLHTVKNCDLAVWQTIFVKFPDSFCQIFCLYKRIIMILYQNLITFHTAALNLSSKLQKTVRSFQDHIT